MEIPGAIGRGCVSIAGLMIHQMNFCTGNHSSRGVENLAGQGTGCSGLAVDDVRKNDGNRKDGEESQPGIGSSAECPTPTGVHLASDGGQGSRLNIIDETAAPRVDRGPRWLTLPRSIAHP